MWVWLAEWGSTQMMNPNFPQDSTPLMTLVCPSQSKQKLQQRQLISHKKGWAKAMVGNQKGQVCVCVCVFISRVTVFCKQILFVSFSFTLP